MKFTVMYAFELPLLPGTSTFDRGLAELKDASAVEDYLRHRGIEVFLARGPKFSIIYTSPAHRTATELIMSGCPRTCTLTATEVIE